MLSEGPVRSGKSHASIVGFGIYILSLTDEPRYQHLLLGKNVDSMESAVIEPLMRFCHSLGVSSHFQPHKSRLTLAGGRHLCWVRGCENKASETALQGLNCTAALFDEIATYPINVFSMAYSRLSKPESKCWATCNPDSPKHWLMTDVIQKGLLAKHYKFDFDDNPSLDDATKERLSKSFHGAWHRRRILGEWCEISGMVFEDYRIVKSVPSKIRRCVIACDPGNGTISAILLLCEHENGTFTFYDEKIIQGRHSDDAIVDEVTTLAEKYQPESVIVDSAASSTFESLRQVKDRKYLVKKSSKDTNRAIRVLTTAFANQKCRIHSRCKNLLKELPDYVWNPTTEKPVKGNDHSIDCAKYSGLEMLGKPARKKPVPLRKLGLL